MTGGPDSKDQLIVFDTVVLNHFALAERLDVLGDLLLGSTCATTAMVIGELKSGVNKHPTLTAAES